MATRALTQFGRSLTRAAGIGLQSAAVPRRYLPFCTIDTNITNEAIRQHFLPGFSKLIAETLNKSEKVVSISLRTNSHVSRDGTSDPAVLAEICSIGVFDEEKNIKYSKVFMEYLSSQLGVPTERIALILRPLAKHEAAHVLYAETHRT